MRATELEHIMQLWLGFLITRERFLTSPKTSQFFDWSKQHHVICTTNYWKFSALDVSVRRIRDGSMLFSLQHVGRQAWKIPWPNAQCATWPYRCAKMTRVFLAREMASQKLHAPVEQIRIAHEPLLESSAGGTSSTNFVFNNYSLKWKNFKSFCFVGPSPLSVQSAYLRSALTRPTFWPRLMRWLSVVATWTKLETTFSFFKLL
jgi:hypothetical protein